MFNDNNQSNNFHFIHMLFFDIDFIAGLKIIKIKICYFFHTEFTRQVSKTICKSLVISTKAYGSENSWNLGSCTGFGYSNNRTYYETCCLRPGHNYTLNCINSAGHGWHGGSIRIGGSSSYCGNFKSGFTKTEQIYYSK